MDADYYLRSGQLRRDADTERPSAVIEDALLAIKDDAMRERLRDRWRHATAAQERLREFNRQYDRTAR